MSKRSKSESTTAPRTRAAASFLAIVALVACLPSPAGAIPPTPPYRALEERAEREGAATVRGIYRQEVQNILAKLEKKPHESLSLQESLQRTLTIVWLFDYLRSWAFVEARGLRVGETDTVEVIDPVLGPLLDAAEKGMALWAEEMPSMERLKSKAAPGEIERLGVPESLEASVANNRDQAMRQLALLAKLAGAQEQLERVFRVTPAAVDSTRSAKEFLSREHDFDELLHIAKPTVKMGVPAPLTADEQEAIRHAIQDFWDAFVRRDAASVEQLFLDPAAARVLTDRMAEIDLVSFDLTAARFAYERISPDRVKVRVDNVGGVKLQQGRKVETVGGKSFEVELRAGRALIVKVGR